MQLFSFEGLSHCFFFCLDSNSLTPRSGSIVDGNEKDRAREGALGSEQHKIEELEFQCSLGLQSPRTHTYLVPEFCPDLLLLLQFYWLTRLLSCATLFNTNMPIVLKTACGVEVQRTTADSLCG